MLGTESILGGQKIEGVVIKNYEKFGDDKKALMAKFVSEEFKEVHSKAWGESNPGQGDAVRSIGLQFQTQARWLKAVQHLRDSGQYEQSPRDIGNLIKEVKRDVIEECKDEIKEKLWKAFHQQVVRIAAAGLPEWYKADFLLKKQFETEEEHKEWHACAEIPLPPSKEFQELIEENPDVPDDDVPINPWGFENNRGSI